MGPNFRFYVLFLFSDKKLTVFIHRVEYLPYFSGKSHFALLPVFKKSANVQKQAVGKKQYVIFGFRMKKYIR